LIRIDIIAGLVGRGLGLVRIKGGFLVAGRGALLEYSVLGKCKFRHYNLSG